MRNELISIRRWARRSAPALVFASLAAAGGCGGIGSIEFTGEAAEKEPPPQNVEEEPPGVPAPPSCVGPFPEGCIANCAQPTPTGQRCECQIDDCEATSLTCTCDAECFPDAAGNVPADCDIQFTPDGTSAQGDLGSAIAGGCG